MGSIEFWSGDVTKELPSSAYIIGKRQTEMKLNQLMITKNLLDVQLIN